MSQKDKNTLIIAGIALLIVGIIILGIKPAFTSIKETKATNAELSATKQTMKTEIEALPTYEANLKTAIAEYDTTAARVFPNSDNDEIHDIVVNEIVGSVNGLEITSLNINSTNQMSVANYSIGEEGASGGATEGTVTITDVSVTVFGTQAQIIQFVDNLNTTEGTYMQSVSFSKSDEQMAVSIGFYLVLADSFSA